jgi:hypothetical protein
MFINDSLAHEFAMHIEIPFAESLFKQQSVRQVDPRRLDQPFTADRDRIEATDEHR